MTDQKPTRMRRLAIIIKLIANNPGITLSRLAEKLPEFGIDITERTLAKDINVLKGELELLPDSPRLRQGYFLKDMHCLSPDDLSLILDALHVVGTRMDDLQSRSLRARLAEQRSGSRYSQGSPGQPVRSFRQTNILEKDRQYEETFACIQEAIKQCLPVVFSYNTPRLESEVTVRGYPLQMVFYERGWYCITRHLEENTYSPRRLDRIENCSIDNAGPVNQSALENLEESTYLVNCGWGMTFPKNRSELEQADNRPPVVARFDRTVAPFLLEATKRHPKGEIEPVKDGTGSVDFKIRLANPREFLSWVRSFGPRARIMAPPNLVEQELAEARRMYENYSKVDETLR